MKYHKIRNVPLEVCTAEQMVAYKLAFSAHINFQDKFDAAAKISASCANDCAIQIRDFQIKCFKTGYNYNPGRYDEDAIKSALNAGLMKYLQSPFIAYDYETVGKAFPAHYLKQET